MPKYRIDESSRNSKYAACLTRYIETTLHNLYVDLLRKNKSTSKIEFAENLDADARFLVYDSENETDPLFFDNYALAKVLPKLTEKQRFVIIKHYFEGLPNSEIARLLNVTPQASSDLHIRALEELQLHKEEILEFQRETSYEQ